MNSIDDLRSTLDQHADGLHDTERYVRPVAVRSRIRVVRRRRAGAVAAVAAVAVVAAVATVGSLRSPDGVDPAGRSVAGVDVPASIDVLTFPYDLSDLRDLTDDRVHLEGADSDQAVLLTANGLGSGSATLFVNGEPVARVRGDEQVTAPYPIGDSGADLRVRFAGTGDDARAGVAVYAATDTLAPGVDNGAVVFRDEYAGLPLLGAAFADPGASRVDFPARGAASMRVVPYCDAADGLWVNLDIDDEPVMSTSCGAGSRRDATIGSTSTFDGMAADRDHDVRAYLTRGSDGPETAPAEGESFGAGVYEAEGYEPKVLGLSINTQVEFAGRTWVLDPDSVRQADDSSSRSIQTGDTDLLLGYVARGDLVRVDWKGSFTQDESDGFESDRPVLGLAGILLSGDRYEAELTGKGPVQGTLLVYRPE